MQVLIRQNSTGDFELVKIEDSVEYILMVHNNMNECVKYYDACGFDAPLEIL
jgi:hypothetical protein